MGAWLLVGLFAGAPWRAASASGAPRRWSEHQVKFLSIAPGMADDSAPYFRNGAPSDSTMPRWGKGRNPNGFISSSLSCWSMRCRPREGYSWRLGRSRKMIGVRSEAIV
jgi:hypothetical protein